MHNEDDPPVDMALTGMNAADQTRTASPDSYAGRQRARNAAYRREYEAWVQSLPPEERRQLAELGLDEPQMPDTSASGVCDAAELSRCATEPEAFPEDGGANERERTTLSADPDTTCDLLRVLLGELLSQDNARLSIECLALVTGLSYDGDSMTQIAQRHSLTRAAVSKRCVDLARAFNLDPSRAMRSLKARESYRQSRLNHLETLP